MKLQSNLGLDFNDDDMKLVPDFMFELFKQKVNEYDVRYRRLVDMFSITVYQSHVLGAVLLSGKADQPYVNKLLEEAEPEAVLKKAESYADAIMKDDWEFIQFVVKDMDREITKAKAVQGGVN